MSDSGSASVVRGSIERLVVKIDEARGIDLGQYRRNYLERRIAARLRALGIHSYRQYADILDREPAEYDKLIDTLTINVTDFYRDEVMWDSLSSNVLRRLVAKKAAGRNRTIRVWSAACATGEEPYSIAMMMLDMMAGEASKYLVSVTATDLDPEALAVAERGVYDETKCERIPASYQVRFTRRVGASQFEVLPEVKRLVRFRRQNLFDDNPLKAVDLIMCRNVFIYFDRDQQARVLENFWTSLTRGGYLVLGRSEKLSPEITGRLEVIDGRERIYRKPERL